MNCGFMIDELNSATGFTVLGNDTVNLAAATTCLVGSASLEFDKVDGAANKKYAGAYKTIDKQFRVDQFKVTDRVGMIMYISSIAAVDYAFARVGTDVSNYVEWRFADTSITAGAFTFVDVDLCTGYVTGTGWSEAMSGNGPHDVEVVNLDYLSVGVMFDAETDALADIKLQTLCIIPAAYTSA